MGARKPLPADLTPVVQNIVNMFWSATDEDMAAGLAWYAMAHSIAAELDPDDVRIGAGVIAALSPQLGWSENVRLARKAFADDRASGHTGSNVNKANRILWHYMDPLDVLGGQKVRAFYTAIVEPEHTTAVVIDRHAFDIAVGRVTDGATRGVLARVGVYELFADAYREAARRITSELGDYYGRRAVSPSAVQAVTWLAWRRQKGIVD